MKKRIRKAVAGILALGIVFGTLNITPKAGDIAAEDGTSAIVEETKAIEEETEESSGEMKALVEEECQSENEAEVCEDLVSADETLPLVQADIYSEGNFKYTISSNSVTIVEYIGAETDIKIPSMIVGYPVNKIAAGAFVAKTIKKVQVPSSAIYGIQENAIHSAAIIVLGYDLPTPQVVTPTNKESSETKETHVFGDAVAATALSIGKNSAVLTKGEEKWFKFKAGSVGGYKLAAFTGTINMYDSNLKLVATGTQIAKTTSGSSYYIYAKASADNQVVKVVEMIHYTVRYNPNGGRGTMPDQSFTEIEKKALRWNKFYKTGYAFDNWNTKADGSGTAYKNAQQVEQLSTKNNAVVTLYARWKATTYKITFAANGGTNTMPEQKFTPGVSQTIRPCAFKKTGYVFNGWKDQNGNTYSNQQRVTLKKNLTLTAQWKAGTTYKVTFAANGGTGTMSAQSIVSGVSTALSKNTFTKKGYSFDGWTGSDGKTYANGANITISGNVTLTAKWKKVKYTITYNVNGGTLPTDAPASFYVTTDTIKLKNPTKKGYTFAGWFDKSDFSGTKRTEIAKGTTKNITVYAKWTKTKYTITYNLNGGTLPTDAETVFYITSATITLKNPTKKGYTFAGWFDKSDFSGTKRTEIAKGTAKNITVYAKWTVNKYSVAFNANGGKSTMATVTGRAYGTEYTLPKNTFTKSGYKFKGWAKTADKAKAGTVEIANQGKYKNLSAKNGATVTLYAVWGK